MAPSAPRPGAVRQENERDKALLITVDGVTQRLTIGDLGPKDARLVRKLKLGYSLTGMLMLLQDESQVDIDVPCTLWWLARVKAGETKLTYEQAEDEFPNYDEFGERVEIGIDDGHDGGEDDSPEA